MSDSSLPVVAIVGRPNVGKSALFNAMLGRRVAIVHAQSGVTRDRITARALHEGKRFLLVDTGGLGVFEHEKPSGPFDGPIREQVHRLIQEVDQLLWVVDAQAGLTPLDKEIGDRLRRSGRPVTVVANKADNGDLEEAGRAEFAGLGFGDPVPVSCVHRRGVGDLLDAVVAGLPAAAGVGEDPVLRVAVVGRPNVGKSSLVNRLVGEERMLVSEVAGTTRDAVDVTCRLRHPGGDMTISLVDTAGLRRKTHVDNAVEVFSINRAEKAIERCDVVLLTLDCLAASTAQDRRIAHLVEVAGKPCILVANKWDLAAAQRLREKTVVTDLREGLSFMAYAPVVCLSAKTGHNLSALSARLFALREQMQTIVPTSVVNQMVADLTARTPAPAEGTRQFRVYYGTMAGNPPPRFVLFVNHTELCPAAYLRFLENRLQEAFFPDIGLPVRVTLRPRREPGLPDSGQRQAAGGAMRQRQRQQDGVRRRVGRSKGWRS